LFDVTNVQANVKAELAVDTGGVVRPLGDATTAFERTHKKMVEVMRMTKKMSTNFDYLILSLKRIATYSMIFTFFTGMASVLKDVVELEHRFAEVSTLIDTRVRENAVAFANVKEQILSMNTHLGSATNLTRGLYEIMSAGVNSVSEATKLLKVSAEYAKGGLTDLGTAASSLTSIMKAYHLKADDMRKVSDQLFVSVQEGKFHVEDLNAALGTVLPTAAAMGVGVNEVAAALAAMSQQGMDARQAATALNRMLISFLRPIDKAKDWFKKLGWEWGINAFQARSFTERIQDLRNASIRYQGILPEIFRRQRALRGAFILTGKGIEDYTRILGKMDKAAEGAGVTHRAFLKVTKTLKEEIKAFGVQVQQAAMSVSRYTGSVSILVRILGNLFEALIRNFREVSGLILIVVGLRYAIQALNAALLIVQERMAGLATSVYATHVQIKAATAQAAASAARIKAWAGVLSFASRSLMIAIPIYIAAKAAIKSWTDAIDRQIAAERARSDAYFKTLKKYKEIAEIVEEVTDKEVTLSSSIKMMTTHYADISSAFGEYIRKAKGIEVASAKMTKALGYASQEAVYMYKKIKEALEAFFEGSATQEQITLLARVARELGIINKVLEKQIDQWLKVDAVASEVGNRYRTLLRRTDMLNKAVQSIRMLPTEMMDSMTKEDINELAKFLQNLGSYLSEDSILADAFRESFGRMAAQAGLSYENLEKQLESFLQDVVLVAQHQKDQYDIQKRVDDHMRTFISTMEEASMTTSSLQEYAAGLVKAFDMMGKAVSKGQLKEWVLSMKEPLETLKKRLEEVKNVKVREALEGWIEKLEEFRKKSKETNEDYINLIQSLGDDLIKHQSKISQMLAEIEGESWLKVVEQKKAEIELVKRRYQKEIEEAEMAAEKKLEVEEKYNELLKIMQKELEMSQMVAYSRLADQFIKKGKEMIRAERANSEERVRIQKEMYNRLLAYLLFFTKLSIENIKKVMEHYKAGWEELASALRSFSQQLAQALGGFAGDIFDVTKSIKDSFTSLFRSIVSAARQYLAQKLVDLIAESVETIFTNMSNWIMLIMAMVILLFSAINKAINDAKDEMDELTDSVEENQSAVEALIEAYETFGSSLVTFSGKGFNGFYNYLDQALEEIWHYLGRGTLPGAPMTALKELMDIFTAALDAKVFKDAIKIVNELFQKIKSGAISAYVSIDTLQEMIESFIEEGLLNEAWGYMNQVLGLIRSGILDARAASELLGSTFEEMIDAGQGAFRAAFKFIQTLRKMGIEVKEVTEYVKTWFDTGSKGLKAMAEGYTIAEEELQKLIEAQEEFGCATDQYKDLQNQIEALGDELGPDLQDELDRTARLSLTLFESMLSQGLPLIEVFDVMGDAVAALRDRYAALGLEGSEAFKVLSGMVTLKEENEALFKAIQGNVDVLKSLGLTGFLTTESLSDVADQALNYYQRLVDAGYTSEQALRIMAPTLSQLQHFADEYGYTLDATTRSMIQQADQAGFLKDEYVDTADIMKEGFNSMQDAISDGFNMLDERLQKLIEIFGFLTDRLSQKLGRNLKIMEGDVSKFSDNATRDVHRFRDSFDDNVVEMGDIFYGALDRMADYMSNDMTLAGDRMEQSLLDNFDRIARSAGDANEELEKSFTLLDGLTNFGFDKGAGATIPSFQTGALEITKAGFGYIHQGEAILPEQIASALRAFFGKQTTPVRSEDSGNQVIEVNLNVDGERLYHVLVPFLRKGGRYADYEVNGEGIF